MIVLAWHRNKQRSGASGGTNHPRLPDSEHVLTDEWSQRALLARTLAAAYHEGLRWYRVDSPSDFDYWEQRTANLIRSAIGAEVATRFLGDWRRDEQKLSGLDARLQHLWDLYHRVDSVAPLALRPDFKGEDWVSKR